MFITDNPGLVIEEVYPSGLRATCEVPVFKEGIRASISGPMIILTPDPNRVLKRFQCWVRCQQPGYGRVYYWVEGIAQPFIDTTTEMIVGERDRRSAGSVAAVREDSQGWPDHRSGERQSRVEHGHLHQLRSGILTGSITVEKPRCKTFGDWVLTGAWFAALLAFGISCQTLCGYWADVTNWRQWGTTTVPMAPNTATAMFLLALAVLLTIPAVEKLRRSGPDYSPGM